MGKKIQTLNIGTKSVQLAEYELGGNARLTLVRYGVATLEAPLDFETAETILAPALLGLVRETGIRPGPVAMTVPGQSVFTKFAAVPRAGGNEKFEQMIRYEIEQGIPFPIDEMICDRQIIGETENGDTSVMIVAAKADQVEALTRAVASVGFSPEIVDSAPGALTNAVRYLHPELAEACSITLWLGTKTTTLLITEEDKVYTRLIPIGANTIVKEISTACGCSSDEAEALMTEKGYVALGGVAEDEDEVADRISKACRAVMTRLNAEINRSVNFYRSQQHGGAPSKIYLTGTVALLPQIDAFFADALGIEVAFLNPFETVSVGTSVDTAALETEAATLAATTGLAAQAAGVSRFSINLLPPALVQARAEKAKVPFIVAGGLALALALVLIGLGIGNETAVVEAQRDAVQVRANRLSADDRKVTAAQGEFASAQADAEALRKLMDERLVAVRRLKAVREALVPGMWIHSWENGRISVRYWKDRVSTAEGKTAGESFAEKLRGKPGVDSTSVKIAEMSPVGAGGVCEQFTVEVKFK